MGEPTISILTPVFDPPPAALESMLRSVREQTFGDWEHCLVDDGSTAPHVGEILRRAAGEDPRVKVVQRSENGGIAAATNDALAMARGEFVALLDHDDELWPEALERVAAELRDQPTVDYLYTDEDKVDEVGNHFDAFHKPSWSPDRLRAQMYTCHLRVLRRSLVEDVGGFGSDVDGAQDWDLVLRVTERARRVVHLPEVLYSWRSIAGSTAQGLTAKPWAFDAGVRAIRAHCERVGFPAVVEHDPDRPDVYHLRPRLLERPLVSIVIPTGGQVRDVWAQPCVLAAHCVESVVETTTYDDYEIVVVADEQTDRRVLAELRAIAGERLRVVLGDRPFNFSERINLGAMEARGDHLLLLNDDMEVVTPEWIERMVMYSAQPGVGAVGAKLLFEDGRLQHVGVVFQHGGPAHRYRGFTRDYPGYFGDVFVPNNLLAVTGACLMTSREAFMAVGGLSTLFPVDFNDVDYCLKVAQEGYRVVWDPDTVLYHFESSTRPAYVESVEAQLLRQRWGRSTRDPFVVDASLRSVVDVGAPVL
jgi:O-antigen biosynthesis protein